MKRKIDCEPGYESLLHVLILALEQAQHGKGKERHADGQPFLKQDICQITRDVGHGFSRGQAIKKIRECSKLPLLAQVKELLGAVNYLAADVLVLFEEMIAEGGLTEEAVNMIKGRWVALKEAHK